MTESLLGIDLGTSMLKLGLFDANTGRSIAEVALALPLKTDREGARETPTAGLDRSFRKALRALRAQAGDRWKSISGVGIASQGGSTIIVNRETGEALTPMYLWNDARCHGAVQALGARKPPAYWRSLVSYSVPPTGLGRMAWLKERAPDLFQPENLHVGAGEFMFHRLTGVWRQDPGHAIQIGSYNAWTRKTDGKAFKLIDVPISFVAPLRVGHSVEPVNELGARLLGIKPGVPVAGPYLDQEGGYMSVLHVGEKPLQCSLGTAWVGNFMVSDESPWSSSLQMVLPPPRGAGRFVVQALPSGNVAWDWALAAWLDADPERALKKANAIFGNALLPPDGLQCLPWFSQSNPLFPEFSGGGALLGLSHGTAASDIIRAVAAGLVFELRRFLGEVASKECDAVVLGGGASRGVYFQKLIAAVLHPTPVFIQVEHNLGAARGVLHRFGTPASRAKVADAPKPSPEVIRSCTAQYANYESAFERVYGDATRAGYRL